MGRSPSPAVGYPVPKKEAEAKEKERGDREKKDPEKPEPSRKEEHLNALA